MSEIIVYTDGASRGNPGQAAISAVISGSNINEKVAQKIGITTNNVAEYQAIILACIKLIDLNIESTSIHFFSDSELIVRQITGFYRVKDNNLRNYYNEVTDLIDRLRAKNNQLEFSSIKREKNREADKLVNLALDGKI